MVRLKRRRTSGKKEVPYNSCYGKFFSKMEVQVKVKKNSVCL